MNLNTDSRKTVLARDYTGTLTTERTEHGTKLVSTEPDGSRLDVVQVPTRNVRDMLKRFEKLCRKAKRLGLDEPVLAKVGDLSEKFRTDVGIDGWKRYALYTVEATPVHFDGWSFVATIEHIATEDGYRNVVRTSPRFEGEAIDPIIRTSRPVCEHCNTARKRNDTFVIQHDDGKRMQVGRNCMKDYLGDATGAEVLSAASFEREIRAFIDEGWGDLGGFGSRGDRGYDVVGVLAVTVAAVERFGFMSRSKARDYGYESTADMVHFTLEADRVRHDIDLRRKWRQDDGHRFVVPWGDAERERAATIIDWAATIPDDTDSDYLWNLKVVCSLGGVTGRELGILCSAVNAYGRATKGEARRKAREAAKATSDHFGAAGDKIGRKLSAADKRKGATAHEARTVTVAMTKLFDGYYGTKELVSMTDEDGNVFKWFASGHALSDDGERVTEGETYTLVATIKGHGEYAGVKETNLNRCVLTRA